MQEATQLSGPNSTESPGEVVSIFVDSNHPLLQLKRALPWGEILRLSYKKFEHFQVLQHVC